MLINELPHNKITFVFAVPHHKLVLFVMKALVIIYRLTIRVTLIFKSVKSCPLRLQNGSIY